MSASTRSKRKKTTLEIKSHHFNGSELIKAEDLEKVRAETEDDAFKDLVPGWTGEIIAYLALNMKPDNTAPADGTIILKGSIFNDRPHMFGASKFFDLKSPYEFLIENLDCSKFRFPGIMTSAFVDSSHFSFWFRKDINSPELSPEQAFAEGFPGFSLRAFLQPTGITTNTWLKINIQLYPLDLQSLLDSQPQASSASFPGITIYTETICLAAKTSDIFPFRSFGMPVWPAIISSKPFTNNDPMPTTSNLIACISAILRAVVIPNAHLSHAVLLPRWAAIKEQGAAGLKVNTLDILWPKPSSTNPPTQGRFLFSSKNFPLFTFMPFPKFPGTKGHNAVL